MNATVKETAEILKNHSKIYVFCHRSPDGDTIGAASALCHTLYKLGKKAKLLCSDNIPPKYEYLTKDLQNEDFEPDLIVAVDIADLQLLGDKLSVYGDKIDLCIDHHASNTFYAKKTLLDSTASAACQVLYEVIKELGVEFDVTIGTGIYTGISTDTGCFRYANTVPQIHRIAAEMMEVGTNAGKINRAMFETKSKNRLAAECEVLGKMEYAFDGRCAAITFTKDILENSGIDESELEGVATMPRQIEGVEVGITIKERKNGEFKISMRSNEYINVSDVCGTLGGGGHKRAAGCTIKADSEKEVKDILYKALEPAFLASK